MIETAEHTGSATARRSLKMLVVALAVVFASALAPAAASAAPAPQAPVIKSVAQAAPGDVSAQASWQCSYNLGYYVATANCTVYSGYIRLLSYCSGYGYIATAWVGRGSWTLRTNCYPYQRTGSWIQSYG